MKKKYASQVELRKAIKLHCADRSNHLTDGSSLDHSSRSVANTGCSFHLKLNDSRLYNGKSAKDPAEQSTVDEQDPSYYENSPSDASFNFVRRNDDSSLVTQFNSIVDFDKAFEGSVDQMCFGSAVYYRNAESAQGLINGSRFISEHDIMTTESFKDESRYGVFSDRNSIIKKNLEKKAYKLGATILDYKVMDTGNHTMFDSSSSINQYLDAYDFDDLQSQSLSDSFSKFI